MAVSFTLQTSFIPQNDPSNDITQSFLLRTNLRYFVVTNPKLQVAMALGVAAEVATARGGINYFMFW